ncbi:MAG TPA: ROK family protein [Candidatus Nitrosotalea sp.]|nr:ROK family protein [Candidatus Nitrosotalea sp.]
MIAGVDLGGTQIRIAVAGSDGRVTRTDRTHTADLVTPERVVSWAAARIRALVQRSSLDLVTVGAPGPIDQGRGVLVNPPNLPGWHNVPLVEMVQRELGCRALIENDANLAAVGEHARGAGQGVQTMVYITWSTGVGGGLIINGRLWSGAHGSAGEIGHMIIDPAGPLDSCGQRGCLEAFCGGRALSRASGESADVLFAAAAGGDHDALRRVTAAAEKMGLALINLSNLFDPDLFVVGGGVTRSWRLVAPVMRATLRASPFIRPARRPGLRRARLGDDGGLVGALEWARIHL